MMEDFPMTEIVLKTLKVQIPEQFDVRYADKVLTVVKGKESNSKRLFHPKVNFAIDGHTLTIESFSLKRKDLATMKTFKSHIENLIQGLTEGFTYKMKIVFSHFPMKVMVKKEQLIIENFLGEKHPRNAKILESATVKVQGDEVTVTGKNKEKVAQTAANIEHATRIKDKDPRVFQDGIYIYSKEA